MDPDLFWRQTPRLNHSAVKGRAAMYRRESEASIRQARWSGFFAQVAIKEHDKVLKKLLAGKSERRVMTGSEIGAAMRAWVRRS